MAAIQILSDLHLEAPRAYDVFEITPRTPYLALLGGIADWDVARHNEAHEADRTWPAHAAPGPFSRLRPGREGEGQGRRSHALQPDDGQPRLCPLHGGSVASSGFAMELLRGEFRRLWWWW
ncbi:hypothetical protein DL770_002666 [Monosporascus sp. CRB-9-2]|nr:hypothetical protein DL770_002666 [Monosporascus sp. CRB-9-2]